MTVNSPNEDKNTRAKSGTRPGAETSPLQRFGIPPVIKEKFTAGAVAGTTTQDAAAVQLEPNSPKVPVETRADFHEYRRKGADLSVHFPSDSKSHFSALPPMSFIKQNKG